MKFLRGDTRKEDVSGVDQQERNGVVRAGWKEVRWRRKRSGKKEAWEKKKVARDGG